MKILGNLFGKKEVKPPTEAILDAAYEGQIDKVRALLKSDANVNSRDKSGQTALIRASGKGFADAVDLLLNSGAEVNARDSAGATALLYAPSLGHIGSRKGNNI